MSESRNCPECGSGWRGDAPGGLCPMCLLRAGAAESRFSRADTAEESIEDRLTEFGPRLRAAAVPVELDQFKKEVLELGLIPALEFERFLSGALGGVKGLARALVLAGRLTPYQAGALTQGKARGLIIGNYLILEKLGAGGMGVVFKARHRRLGRVVALKILPPSLARNRDLLTRFRREVDVAAKLNHPNIVSVLDANEDRGVQFMTMEFIKGHDLDRLVRDGGVLPVELALDCTIQAARGLEAAHALGIVHRDVKPGNLMLDESGLVRVLDLGLARLVEASNPFGETGPGALTQPGAYMGTVDFMAPEQGIDSRRVDYRADIYSLGCTLCYLLTGRAPFDGPNALSRLMAHQERPPASLLAARPELSRTIDAAYQKMMAKRAADRPQSMIEVIALLEACRTSSIEGKESQSRLKNFAETVIIKQAALKAAFRDSFELKRAERSEGSLGPDREVADVFFDDPAAWRPRAPVVSGSPPSRERTAAPGSRRWTKSTVHAFAAGALALLGLGGMGYALISRDAGKPAGDRALSPGHDRRSAESPAAPPPATFDVATLHTNLDAEWRAVSVSADGRHALVGGMTQWPELLNLDNGNVERGFGWHFAAITDVAITPDGRRGLVATFSVGDATAKKNKMKAGGTLWFRDLRSESPLFPLQQPYDGHVTAVAVSADGRFGLSGGEDGELTLWDMTTGHSVRSLGPQQGEVSAHAMAFFPDGRHAATAGRDKLVHIWEIETGRQQAAWTGHDGTIRGLAISADGRKIVTGSDDKTVILWDVDSGAVLYRFLMPANDKSARVAFDSEGHVVAAGNGLPGTPPEPGNLMVWDSQTFALVRRDERPFARHKAVATLPGGRVLTCDEFAVRIWKPRAVGTMEKVPPDDANRSKDPVDLNALVDHKPHKKFGNWQVRKGELLSPATRYARIQVPYAPISDYRIDMKVELVDKEASPPLGIGLVVGGRQTEIVIDTVPASNARLSDMVELNGRYTGINGVDGLPPLFGPDIYHGQLLFPSRPVQLVVIVRGGGIRMTCDDRIVVEWNGDPKQLIRHLHWDLAGTRSLFLSSNTSVLIQRMTLTPL